MQHENRWPRPLAALLLLALSATLLLSGCTLTQPLLSDVQATPDTVRPDRQQAVDLRYQIGADAFVTIYLENEQGERYPLREDERRAASDEPYILRFDGTIGGETAGEDARVQRRLLPNGDYTAVVQARTESGERAEQRVALRIAGAEVPLPAIENLTAWPPAISPNADAIDDVAEITYRLPVTTTVDMTITTPGGQVFPLVAGEEEEPAEQRHVWDGKRPDDALLPAGVYTYTVRAEDRYGQLVQRQGNIVLEDVGQPEATIVEARIAPEQIMLGGTITVTMRIRNTGDVPIRTYGPPSGYTYTTDEVYSSIEDGRYTAQAGGFWRVGMDWDANAGGGPRRYPFRWALSERPPDEWTVPGEEDWLLPGEEVEVVGQVVVLQRETKMGFHVGLIQDGVGFFQDRTARTIVEVGF
jgi:hypothetical protein